MWKYRIFHCEAVFHFLSVAAGQLVLYHIVMIIAVFVILFLAFVIWAFAYKPNKGKRQPPEETRYAKTGTFMDFDPGADSDKVGNPKYPNAGIDSVMKYEFLDDILKNNDKK